MSATTRNQCDQVLAALRRGPMTASDARKHLGIDRLAARVFDLRQDGWDITSRLVTVHNRHGEPCRVARYTLTETVQRDLIPAAHPGRGRLSA